MRKPSLLHNVYFPYEDLTPNSVPPDDDAATRTILEDPGFGIIVLSDAEQTAHRTIVVYSAEQALAITQELDRRDALRAQLQAEVRKSALRERAPQPPRVFDATVGELLAEALDKGEHRVESAARIDVYEDIQHFVVGDEDGREAPFAFVHGPCRTSPGYVTHLVRTVEQHDKALYETAWELSPNNEDASVWREHVVQRLPNEHPEPALTLTGRQGLYIGLGLVTIQTEWERTALEAEARKRQAQMHRSRGNGRPN